jgi:hypothetical protein
MRVAAARQLIERRYAAVHGATPATDYPHFCLIEGRDDGPTAALGFRLAESERLFLEAYLDAPIEDAVSAALGMLICRHRIVEIGAHASERSRATMALWARTARHLAGVADVAVAVLTEPLREMFVRLGIPIREICDADPKRLSSRGQQWGRYYEQNPKVCAGLIAPALPRLVGFDESAAGICA